MAATVKVSMKVNGSELENSRQRLAYYTQLKNVKGAKTVDKWIEIYSDRVSKMERQLKRLEAQQNKLN
jgi:hypothetical protein